MIWVLIFILLVIALVFVLRPMLVMPPDFTQGTEETVYLEAQVNDVATDMAVGGLAETEAVMATTDAKRRWKASLRAAEKQQMPVDRPMSKVIAMIALAVAPIAALGLYVILGNPSVSLDKVAYQPAAIGDHVATMDQNDPPSLRAAIAQLQERLAENPEDGEGWRLLGESFQSAGEYQFALTAYNKASELMPERASLVAAQAEVMILLAQGVVEEDALGLLQRTLTLDENNPRAQFYLASYLYQQGQKERALTKLKNLDQQTPEGAIWQATVKAKIADISAELGVNDSAKGSSEAQVRAAEDMTDAQRQSMIEGMVRTLEARLAEQPEDLDGWLMLARSYTVLGNADKSSRAYEQAVTIAPADITPKAAYMEMLLRQWPGPGADVPGKAAALATEILAINPDHPFALFIAGATLQSSDPDQARRYWQRLADIIPASTSQHTDLQALIDGLD